MRRLGFLVFMASLIGCNHIDQETPRSFVNRLVDDTRQERAEIASQLVAGEKTVALAGPLVLKRRNGIKPTIIDFGWITAKGSIVAHSKEFGVVVIFDPSVSDGKVKWICITYPQEAKSKVCLDQAMP